MQFKALALLAAIGGAVAQRPSDMPICDYYTTALLKTNNATNQYTLLTLLVNTAVIGNYTQPNKLMVPGILNPKGSYNKTAVNLVPYFDGSFNSTNSGGKSGARVNFLDGGGAAPLMKNMPANDSKSKQYTLLTHLYEFFGDLLGCTMVGKTGFAAYSGDASMYSVHKFMALDPFETGYFIEQVALSAASFGVATADIEAVGQALGSAFNFRCEKPIALIKAQGPQLQSICTDKSCPLAVNSSCTDQPTIQGPVAGNTSSSSTSSASGTSSPTSTASGAASTTSGSDATKQLPGVAGFAAAVVAAIFAL